MGECQTLPGTKPETDLFGDPIRCFGTDALGFLIGYAKACGGEAFGSEHVVLAAQAARDGHIRRDPSFTYRRQLSNNSIGVGWRAC